MEIILGFWLGFNFACLIGTALIIAANAVQRRTFETTYPDFDRDPGPTIGGR